jgi:hypothetical protein
VDYLLPAQKITCAKLQFGSLRGTDYLGDGCVDWSHIEINLTKPVVENEP